MAGVTNKGKVRMLEAYFLASGDPTNFFVALVTDAAAPTADTDTLSQLTEIADGNGYTEGGYQINRDGTDFDVLTEADLTDQGIVQVKDVVWTAGGGNIPDSGGGARYAVLTDDNVTVADREIFAYWDLVAPRTVSDGQALTLQNLEVDLNES